MRGIYTPVTDIRRKVFTEVARMAYNANELSDYAQLMRELPFKIIPGEEKSLRSSIFLERAIVSERIRCTSRARAWATYTMPSTTCKTLTSTTWAAA